MENFYKITENRVLLAAVIAWCLSQAIKFFTCLFKTKKMHMDRIMGSGGMPSSHSASVMAATFSLGEINGYAHPFFWCVLDICIYCDV